MRTEITQCISEIGIYTSTSFILQSIFLSSVLSICTPLDSFIAVRFALVQIVYNTSNVERNKQINQSWFHHATPL